MSDKISIIIPVYNVEPYLSKCLNSVINQTYSNLEILCIDDGSTDNCGVILDEYVKKDNRIIVIHKKNGGVSSAKNIGLTKSTGNYIGFVDPDDYIEPEMFEILYNSIINNKSQISICSYFIDTDDNSKPITNKITINNVIKQRELLLYPLQRDDFMGYCGYLWNKLFSADLIKNIKFDENIRYAEDVLFYTNAVLSKEECIGVYNDIHLYHYYQHENAVTKTKSANLRADVLKVYSRISQMMNNQGFSEDSYWANGFYCHHARVIAEIAVKINDLDTLRKMQNDIRKYYDDYVKTNLQFPEKLEKLNKILKENL